MSDQLKGKVAIITGAASGMGKAWLSYSQAKALVSSLLI